MRRLPYNTQDHRVGGRHELGQNFLADRALIAAVQRLVAEETAGPIVELGAGDGALTGPLARLGRPVTALEIDPRRVRRLRDRFGGGGNRGDDSNGSGGDGNGSSSGGRVAVVQVDVLRHRFPSAPHTIVGNIPFHLTTAIIRKLMRESGWSHAVLIVQWEVARRRAGVGGASLLTASWWPWYEFALDRRIPAAAFRPVPSVDAGLLLMRRRASPLVPRADQAGYQDFVRQVFQAPGRGVAEMIGRTGRIRRDEVRDWMRRNRIPARALPKDLTAEQWAGLWRAARR
ncbi:MAG: 23S ribosomal RNA methyltransferase Erm [Catenulispora sp.]|nr:23S ribosomal RNA methyltransferase Erm [Catenulispora sp.]